MSISKTSPVVTSRLSAVTLPLVILGFCFVPFTAWSVEALVAVPSTNFGVEGNSNQTIPFGSFDYCGNGMRYQQLYEGSQISLPFIKTLAFRLDADAPDVGPVTYSGVTVSLSSTQVTQETMSQTFADNIGSDETVVYIGDLVVNPSTSMPSDMMPNPFDFEIVFSAPFHFNGSEANLLLDFTSEGCNVGQSFALDAVSGDTDLTRRFAFSKDDLISEPAEVVSVGLVTRFHILTEGFMNPMHKSLGSGGNWTVVGHDGEGFLFEPLPNGRVVIFWFTYDLFGDQMWLLGIAEQDDFQVDSETGQDVATVDMYRTGGPSFGSDFDPADYAETFMGTATFRLDGCQASEGAAGTVEYNLNFGIGMGTYDIEKLYDIYKNDCSP